MKKLIVFPGQGGRDLAAAAAGREEIIARGGLGIEVVAVGGIISVTREPRSPRRGAYAALAASAAAWNPRLAAEIKRTDPTI